MGHGFVVEEDEEEQQGEVISHPPVQHPIAFPPIAGRPDITRRLDLVTVKR